MENTLDTLIEILEISVKKNGVVVLTNQHLLNILKMVNRWIDEKEDALIQYEDPNWTND